MIGSTVKVRTKATPASAHAPTLLPRYWRSQISRQFGSAHLQGVQFLSEVFPGMNNGNLHGNSSLMIMAVWLS